MYFVNYFRFDILFYSIRLLWHFIWQRKAVPSAYSKTEHSDTPFKTIPSNKETKPNKKRHKTIFWQPKVPFETESFSFFISFRYNKWQLMLLYNTFEWAKKNREKRRPETQLKWTIPNKYKTLTTPHSILLYFEIPLNVSNNFKGTFVQRRKWINRMSREQKRERELVLRSRRDVY